MKFTLEFMLLLAAALVLLSLTKAEQAQASIFLRTFEQLHGEPPSPLAKSRSIVQTYWMEQKLDQFKVAEDRTWLMRYMSNDEFYVEGGPIFIFVGGEWSITPGFIIGGHMFDMAKEHNGYLVYTEHRYYGQSKPTDNLSTENLQYLDVRQALADLANFIRQFKDITPGLSDAKVILVGGSYSASMVTWFKKIYPDLAAGCWASSAPLLAKVDFVEYKEITGESITLVGGPTCYSRIRNAIRDMELMFEQKRGAEIKAMFRLCDNFDESDDMDLWNFFSEISDVFAAIVQTHDDGQIQGVCSDILEGSTDVIGLASYIMKVSTPRDCNDISYKAVLDVIMDTTYNVNQAYRLWIYQTCNEFGWYQTSGSQNQPFGTKFPLLLYTTMCQDAYGAQFTNEFIYQQIDATNAYFGGMSPEVDDVYMTHGQLDPWRAMGIQNESLATVVPGYAHCKDFESISEYDTPAMRASKQKIAELVREWVAV